MFLKSKIIFTSIAIVGVLSSTLAAHAGPAKATTSVNVRTGPGTNFKVVDRLGANEVVDATECYKNSWCYVKHEGDNGWVSAKYLTAVQSQATGGQKNCKFIFRLDKNGPTFNMECDEPENFGDVGDENDVPNFNQQANGKKPTACLYTGINFTGAEICQGVSTHRSLRGMNDIFASVKLFNGAVIKLCSENGFRGACKTYSQDRARLHTELYKAASSMQVFSQFEQTNVTPKLPDESRLGSNSFRGRAALRIGQRLNLDNGAVNQRGSDLQYARANNGALYMRALNGAAMSIGRRNERGYEGCRVARFNSQQVRFNQMPVGSYICVKTSEGNIAQYKVNNYSNNGIDIGFETFR